MSRRVLPLLVLLVALTVAAPGRADDAAPWSVWLVQPTCPAPKLVRIGLDGSADIQPFGCPDGGDFPSPVAFSADVSRMAYCKYGSVRIVDFVEDFSFHISLDDIRDCSITPQAFDRADKRYLAIGTTHYVQKPELNSIRAYGELQILDIDAVKISARLATDDEALAPYYRRSYPNTADMPYVRSFEGGRVVFAPIAWGPTLPSRLTPMLGWQTGEPRVELAPTEGQWGEDQLATGEAVWYDADPSLPQAPSSGQASLYNVVLWAAQGIAPRIVYTAPLAIADTMFIDGGRRIAFSLSGVNVGPPTRWLALDRSGHFTELPGAPLVGTPDGYLYTSIADPFSGTQLYRVVQDGPPTLIWQGAGLGWQLAGHTPLPAVDALPPFPPAPH